MDPSTDFFVICIENRGYPASLEPKKVYRAMRDPQAEAHGLLRVVDESGEDYLFPAAFFAPIEIPVEAESVFSSAG